MEEGRFELPSGCGLSRALMVFEIFHHPKVCRVLWAPTGRSEKRGKRLESSLDIVAKVFVQVFPNVNIKVTRGHQT